uniref:Palmitoyltransferase n=1 Tax=Mucochytrium quahogii TaxID=96639 RepID=A0A7S2W600_9STRA|mmetsp:Transcript_17994/g.29193  ORF Transcript_17994/g.29193 Transcript_17994/m.29193 type:complete len:238 (+) Transcript_17994:117-830(+)
MKHRKHGFQRPFTNDQMLSWVAEPIAAVMFYLVVATFTFGDQRIVYLSVYSVLLAAHLVCWLLCSLLDPSVDEGCFWPCMKEAQKEKRYCAVCHKSVIGLDHHCTWLNTCIGKRQYPWFFSLVAIGFIMFWFETILFILLLTKLFTDEVSAKALDVFNSVTTYKVLVSLCVVFAGGLAIALSVLFVFHLFLQFTGMGTYAWMIDGRNKKVAKKKAQKQNTVQSEANVEQASKTVSNV